MQIKFCIFRKFDRFKLKTVKGRSQGDSRGKLVDAVKMITFWTVLISFIKEKENTHVIIYFMHKTSITFFLREKGFLDFGRDRHHMDR